MEKIQTSEVTLRRPPSIVLDQIEEKITVQKGLP